MCRAKKFDADMYSKSIIDFIAVIIMLIVIYGDIFDNFGNVPYKNNEFNIYQAPAFWIAFTNEQNKQATEYVHTLIEQVADSFSY